LDPVNRILLDRIQRAFPLTGKPYLALGEGLGIGERETRRRIGTLKEEGLVRQIGAIFNTGAVGYQSSLVAMSVPDEEVERAAEAINRYPGVSHNYLRPGRFNLWYTVAIPPGRSVEALVEKLSRSSGGWPTLVLPALRKFKLAVVLDVLEEGGGPSPAESPAPPPVQSSAPFELTESNIRVVRCIQEDLPLQERPFLKWARDLDMGEEQLLDLTARWVDRGIVRRFAAVLNHRQAGFNANGMIVWRCPESSMEESGRALAAYPEVSHCYERKSHPRWPYNLYAMVHGRTEEECRRIAEKLASTIGIMDYRILFSRREFKKIRLKLFWDET